MPVRHFSLASATRAAVPAKGGLYANQDAMPLLPVPPLAQTAAKYLDLVKAVADPVQYKNTERYVQEFTKSGGIGEKLQARLEQRAATERNWLSEWWDDYAYMSYRDLVVPYVLYFIGHKDLRGPVGKDQLKKAALMAHEVAAFWTLVVEELIPAEEIKGTPYCMELFKNLFNNLRVPASPLDTTVYYKYTENPYFVVVVANRFYKVHHHTPEGTPYSVGEIYAQLLAVEADARGKGPSATPVGALTSVNRDLWTSAYGELLKSPVNEFLMLQIHAALFVVCLDLTAAETLAEREAAWWHGDGQNRFYDKPLQFIVALNGALGFLGEHLRMDATPTNFLNVNVCKSMAAAVALDKLSFEFAGVDALAAAAGALEIKFEVLPAVRGYIGELIAEFRATIDLHDRYTWLFVGYGKNFIKQCKVLPDAYVQLLFQLAYYKYTGTLKPTYELAATRKYYKGRTETCRSLSPEAAAFVHTFVDPAASAEAKQAAFQTAAAKHVKNIGEALNANGVDRHLFGLKQLYNPDTDGALPDLFADPMYAYSGTWLILSLQIPSDDCYNTWGWLQVNDIGFGLAYLINSDWLNVLVCCKKGNGLSLAHLGYYLTEAALEMREVLVGGKVLRAKL